MKMATITGVSDSNIATTDGIKSQIGDFNARVGDHVWVDKNCVYGHETGGGTAPTVIGGIPLLSYTLQHGVLAGNRLKYKSKEQFSGGEPWDHDSGKFVNDKSSAYYLPIAYDAPKGQYDLLKGETVSNLQLYQIFDACIDQTEDGPVLVLAGDTTESYGWACYGDYHYKRECLWDGQQDQYGLQMGPDTWTASWEQKTAIINRASDIKVYRAGEVAHNVTPRIQSVIDQAKATALAMSESYIADSIVNQFSATEIKTVVEKDGAYEMSGSCTVTVYYDVAYQTTTHHWFTWDGGEPPPVDPAELDHSWEQNIPVEAENSFKFLWTVTGDRVDVTLIWSVLGWYNKKNIIYPPPNFYDVWPVGWGTSWKHSAEYTYTLPPDYTTHYYVDQYKFPLNDGFYYIAHGDAVSDSGAASTFDIFDAEGNLIVELGEDFTNYNYTNVINCIAAVSGGRHLIALNDAYLTLIVVKEGAPTVIEVNEEWPGLQNARLVETSKLKKIKSGFEKYFDVE